MNLEATWTQGAESDLLEIFCLTEDFSAGTGERILNQTSELVGLLRKQPFLGRQWLGSVRKVNIRRSGLGLFYVIEHRRLVVIAVLNLRRSESSLLDEIKRRLPR
jgi:plasmid stabilization system protein ParE